MFETNDADVLKRAYETGEKTFGKQSYPKERYMSERADIIRTIDKVLVVSRDIYFTELEKQNILRKCKNALRNYCRFVKGNPEALTEQLLQRKEELLSLIISLEVPLITRFRRSLGDDDYLDLEEIFSKHRYTSELVREPITQVLENAVKDKEIRAIKKYKLYYMTRTGNRYHVSNCPCCRGKILCVDNEFNLVTEGIKPCRCVKKAYERAEYIGLKKELEKKYITAFVDESRKSNPGHKIIENLGKKQNTISIILCIGKLRSEGDITERNTIGRYIHVTEDTDKLYKTTFEAIGTAMLKASLMGINKKMIIYTDNQGASSKWRTCKPLELLSRGFPGVSVKFIKREKNTEADGLIRQNSILQLPRDKMNEVITSYMKMSDLYRELDKGIDDMENGRVTPHEETMETIRNRYLGHVQKTKEMIYKDLEKSRKCYECGEYDDFDEALDDIIKKI